MIDVDIVGNQEIFELLSRSKQERVYAMEIRDIGSLVKHIRHKNSEIDVSLAMVDAAIIVADVNNGKKLTKVVTGGEIVNFNITDVTDVAKSTEIESESVIYAWSRDEAAISVNAGAYSINGGEYTSNPGFIYYGDSAKVKITSSPDGLTTVTVNLTVGTETEAFDVTTVV